MSPSVPKKQPTNKPAAKKYSAARVLKKHSMQAGSMPAAPVTYGSDTHEGLAELLCSWVALLVDDPEHEDADQWEGNLDTLISDLLEAGVDQVLSLALERAAVYNPFAVHELRLHIEDAAIRSLVTFERAQRAAALMTVPVLISEDGLPFNGMLSDALALNDWGDSLKRSLLLPPESHVVVAACLYQRDELESLTPSQVLRLPQYLLDEAGHNAVGKDLGRVGCLEEPGYDAERACEGGVGGEKPGVQLRYLVLVVLDGSRAEFVHDRLSIPSAERRRSLIENWRTAAGPALAQVLGLHPGQAQVLGFESFFDGMRQGAKAFQDLELRQRLESLLTEGRVSPRAVTAIIAAYMVEFDFKEVRLSLVSKLSHTLLTGEVYPVIDDQAAHRAVGRMKSVLDGLAIEDLTIVPMPLPMEQTGSGDRERVFLTAGKTTDEIARAHATDTRLAVYEFSVAERPGELEASGARRRKLH